MEGVKKNLVKFLLKSLKKNLQKHVPSAQTCERLTNLASELLAVEDTENILLLLKQLYYHIEIPVDCILIKALEQGKQEQKLAISIIFKYRLENILT